MLRSIDLNQDKSTVDWNTVLAARWRNQRNTHGFWPIAHPHVIGLNDLKNINSQIKLADQNTLQFVLGYPANNVLLTGARGTGKSSLVKAVFHKYSDRGLRLVEINKSELLDLPEIVEHLCSLSNKFILFCDDLSFSSDDIGYTALKAVLDGSIAAPSENVLIYATSNRRHLMPESIADNLAAHRIDDEIHLGESVEEKISLSERFGIWISFQPFTQEQYLTAVDYWLEKYDTSEIGKSNMQNAARNWGAMRGSYSGRIAHQFVRDCIGRKLSSGKS